MQNVQICSKCIQTASVSKRQKLPAIAYRQVMSIIVQYCNSTVYSTVAVVAQLIVTVAATVIILEISIDNSDQVDIQVNQ